MSRKLEENELNIIEKVGVLTDLIVSYNQVFVFGIRIEISDELLKKALHHIKTKYKILSSVLEYTDEPRLCYTSEKEIIYKIRQELNNDDLNSLIYNEYETEFKHKADLLLRLTKAKYNNLCVLVFTISHIIADGLSSLYLLSDFFKILAHTAEIDEIEVVKSQRYDVLNLSEEANNNFNKHLKSIFASRRVKKFTSMRFITKNLNIEETEQLLSHSTSHQVSLNNVILAAMSMALVQYYQQQKMTINFRAIVNLRPLLKMTIAQSLGDYHSVLSHFLNISTQTDFWELPRSIHKSITNGIAQKLAFKKIANDVRSIDKTNNLDEFQVLQNINEPTVTASSFGKIDFPLYQDLLEFTFAITSYYSGPAFHYHVGDCIINNKLLLIFQYDANALSETQMNALIQQTLSYLKTV